jgi:hypothetical protein
VAGFCLELLDTGIYVDGFDTRAFHVGFVTHDFKFWVELLEFFNEFFDFHFVPLFVSMGLVIRGFIEEVFILVLVEFFLEFLFVPDFVVVVAVWGTLGWVGGRAVGFGERAFLDLGD